MSSVQQSSMVSAKGGTLTPVRTGYEMVIYRRCSDRFAVDAKQGGSVTEVSDRHIQVKYADDSVVGYPLGIEHGVAAGAVIPHRIITDLEVGDTFNEGDALCWNEAYFQRDILNPGGVSMRGGTMAYTAFMETTDTLEDSSAISPDLSGRLATPISKKKTVLLSFDQAISNVVNPGTEVEMDTVLCTIEEKETAGLSEGDSALSDLSSIANQTPRAKFKGKLTRIDVVYMGDMDEMHESLQKLVRWDRSQRKARAKALNKDLPTDGSITSPAFVNGEKVIENTIAVTFYMDAEIEAGVGDKVVFDNALKSIPGRVMEGRNETLSGEPIDALFAYKSVANRIVPNCEIIGTANTVLVYFTRKVVEAHRSRTAKATVLKMIQKVVSDIEGGQENAKLYEQAFKTMSSATYGAWMDRLASGREYISMIVPSGTKMVLDTARNIKVGQAMGIEFFHNLVLTDPMTGEANPTPIKFLVIHLACRRQNQHLVKKQSLPENDRVVDQLSGQVTSVSKGGRISLPELLVLESKGIEKGLVEMIKVRGGDKTAFKDMHEQLRATGEYTLAALANQNDKPVAVKTLRALLLSLHLDNTIGQQ